MSKTTSKCKVLGAYTSRREVYSGVSLKVTHTYKNLAVMLPLAITLLLAGCGGAPTSGGPPGFGGPGGAPGMPSGGPNLGGNPASNIIDNVKNAISGEKTGRVVRAEELLTANANPFLIKLPIPVENTVVSVDPDSGEPAIDPFVGLDLVGVVFNQDSPVALLSVTGMEQTQMVSKGQSVDGQISVTEIGQDHVKLKRDDNGEVVTLYLPDIIGYAPGGNAQAAAPGGRGDGMGGRHGRASGHNDDHGEPGNIAESAMEKVGDIIKGLQDI